MALKKIKKKTGAPPSVEEVDLYSMDQSNRSSPDSYHDERDEVRTDDDKVRLVLSQLKKSVDSRAIYIDPLIREINKQYFAYKKALEQKHRKRSNIRVWHSFKQVESMVPAIYDFVVAGDAPVRVTSLGDHDPNQDAAAATQNLLAYQYLFQSTPKLKMYLALKTNAMYGMSPLKVFWDHRKGYVYDRTPVIKNGKVMGLKREKRLVTKSQHPNFEPYSMDSYYWDPGATCIADARWCIFISTVSMRDLYLNKKSGDEGVYFNLDKIAPMPPMHRTQGLITTTGNIFDIPRGRGTATKNVIFGQYNYQVELVEYWEEDRVLTVANGSTLIQDSDNPFDHGQIPSVVLTHVPVIGQLMGIGVVEPIIDLDRAAALKRNQRIDNVNLSMNAMWAVKKGTQAWPKTIASAPGRTILVDNPREDIQPIFLPDVTAGAFREEDACVSDMDATNGNFPDVTRGEQSDRKEQATVYVGRSKAASNRIGMVGLIVQESFVAMMRMYHELNKQFLPDSVPYLVLGNAGGLIKSARYQRNQLFREYEFAIGDVGFWGNREVEFGRISQMLPVLMQSPLIDQEKMFADLFRQLGVKDPYRWLKKPQDPQYNFSDPRQENFSMYTTGRMADISPLDNHVEHHLYHKLFVDGANPDSMSEMVIDLVRQHDQGHVQFIMMKMQAAAGGQGGQGGMGGPGRNGLNGTPGIPAGEVPAGPMGAAQNAGNAASRMMVGGG